MFLARYKIQPEDQDLIEEFMNNPFGPHSLRLQRILNLFRGGGAPRFALLCLVPHKEWMLITIKGPGIPFERHPDCVFTDLGEAEREIFRRRWRYHTENRGEVSC